MTKPFDVVFPLSPDVTQLDFTGPLEIFARLPDARCVLASVQGEPLRTESCLTSPDIRRLAEIDGCALICVPGGFGTAGVMQDAAYLQELRRLAGTARY